MKRSKQHSHLQQVSHMQRTGVRDLTGRKLIIPSSWTPESYPKRKVILYPSFFYAIPSVTPSECATHPHGSLANRPHLGAYIDRRVSSTEIFGVAGGVQNVRICTLYVILLDTAGPPVPKMFVKEFWSHQLLAFDLSIPSSSSHFRRSVECTHKVYCTEGSSD